MSEQTEQSLVCRLSKAEKEERRPDVEALFRNWLRDYGETETGYRFEFESGEQVLGGLFQFVEAEHSCCPFFRFDITVEPEDGPVSMEIGGSDRVKSYIADQMIPEVEAVLAD